MSRREPRRSGADRAPPATRLGRTFTNYKRHPAPPLCWRQASHLTSLCRLYPTNLATCASSWRVHLCLRRDRSSLRQGHPLLPTETAPYLPLRRRFRACLANARVSSHTFTPLLVSVCIASHFWLSLISRISPTPVLVDTLLNPNLLRSHLPSV